MRLVVVGLSLASAALPAPSARAAARVSVAGDGLALEEGGKVLARIALETPVARRGAPVLEEKLVEGRRVAVVRIPNRARAASEVWLGVIEGGGARRLWGGVTGALDADGEIERVLEVGAEGIVLYEAAARIARCDGVRARVGSQRFDFATGQFRPAPEPVLAPAPVTLVARRADAKAARRRPRVAFPFAVASAPPADATSEGARDLVAPLSLSDGDLDTVWVEKAGPGGAGGALTARAAGGGLLVTSLAVLPGDVRSVQAFARHGRARSLALILGPGERFDVRLEDDAGGLDRRPFLITLPKPVSTSCVTLVAREVIPGSEPRAAATVAWSEVVVFTDLDGGDGGARLVEDLAGPDCASRLGDVAALGSAGAPKLVAALATAHGPGPGRRCLLEALVRISPGGARLEGEAATALTAALPELLRAELALDDERALWRALAVLGRPPVAELGRVLSEAGADPVRARAARALAALADDGAPKALVAALGSGAPALRAELRRLVATPRHLPALHAALAATPAGETARRADLAGALAQAVRGANADEVAKVSTALAALAAAEAEPFEVKARALQGLGALEHHGALAALEQVRRESKDPALRLLATRGLAAAARERPRAVVTGLRAALADGDPAVREAAAQALGVAGDKTATAALIAGAKQEPWPAVRRAEIEAIGRLCGEGAPDLLVRAIERDTLEVRRLALGGVFACRDPRARGLAVNLLREEREPPALRTEAARWLGRAGDRAAAEDLADALEDLAVSAGADLALEATVLATLAALGDLGGPAAVDGARRLRTHPRATFRRAAAEMLGRICTADGARDALKEAAADPDEGVAHAARAALRGCEQPQRPRRAPAVSADPPRREARP